MLPSTSRPREGVTPDWGVYLTRIMIAARLFSPVGNILGQPGGSRTKALPSEKICHGSRLTRRWREPDSNLYGAFPVKSYFGLLPVLCSEQESRSSFRRLRSGSRSGRKGSRDRNGSKAWRPAA